MSFVPPTDEERNVVEVLKGRILSDHPELATNTNFTDTTILRFFRGHKGKEESAFGGLNRHIQWRSDEDVDNIDNRKDEFQVELDKRKCELGKYDLNGRPASFVFAHRHNKNDRDILQVRKLTIWALETLRKSAKPEEERFTIAFDLSGFSLQCMDYEAVKQLIQILQSHYPDTLENLYVVDAPYLFSACWAIIKMWIDPVTANKILFIPRSELTKYFDADSIPTGKDEAAK
jgi:hypothetical protein